MSWALGRAALASVPESGRHVARDAAPHQADDGLRVPPDLRASPANRVHTDTLEEQVAGFFFPQGLGPLRPVVLDHAIDLTGEARRKKEVETTFTPVRISDEDLKAQWHDSPEQKMASRPRLCW